MPTPVFPDIPPDRSSKKTLKNRILVADFGDGYSQVGLDGINTVDETWSMSFVNYNVDEVEQIQAFLDGLNSVTSFFWLAPGDSTQKRWRQEGDYTVSYPGSLTGTITFDIKRVYL